MCITSTEDMKGMKKERIVKWLEKQTKQFHGVLQLGTISEWSCACALW
jgi:hypothetical protein